MITSIRQKSSLRSTVTLPNVLGIGAPRCGTTWLDAQLRHHPEAFMSTARKEIDYFNLYYDRGTSWYEHHFDLARDADHRVIGDVSPRYFCGDEIPDQIKLALGNPRFIVLLRNPVKRMISDYIFTSGRSTKPLDFEQMSSVGWSFSCGFYADHLRNYFRVFDRDRFLIFIFEELFSNVDAHLDKLAEFLAISRRGFDPTASSEKINSSLNSSNPLLNIARKGGRWLRKNDLDGLANLGLKALSILPKSAPNIAPIPDRQIEALYARYERAVVETEELLGRDLPQWRKPASLGAEGTGVAGPQSMAS